MEKRLMSGSMPRLAPAEWHCGDRLWLMDMVAPFGGLENVLEYVAHQVFDDRLVKTFLPTSDGRMQVVDLSSIIDRKQAGAE